MKLRLLLYTLLIVFCFSCKHEKKQVAEELPSQWITFLNHLETNDKVAFKKASGKTIYCYDCLENTPAEMEKMNLMRDTDSLWYDKIYENLVYIPIDSFILNDYDIFFNPKFVQLLKENETLFRYNEESGIERLHIYVTTTPPTAFFEGGQHSFSFTKMNDEWKFTETSTIP